MRFRIISPLVVVATLHACSGTEMNDEDAGSHDAGSMMGSGGGTGGSGGSGGGTAGAGGGAAGTGGGSAGGDQDAGAQDAGGTDAGVDAGTIDSGVIDAGPTDAGPMSVDAGPVILVGVYGGQFLHIEPTTAATRHIANTGHLNMRPIWDSNAQIMRSLVDQNTAPRIGSIDLCTGAVDAGVRLRKADGGTLVHVESIAQAPDGGFYVSVDYDNSASTVSERVGILDLATGLVTPLPGTVNTIEDDVDGLFFIGETLYAFDIADPANMSQFLIVNRDAGTTTVVRSVSDNYRRFAYEPARGVVYAWQHFTNELATVDLATGALTTIDGGFPVGGFDAGSAAYMDGFDWAPRPICP